MEQNSAVNPTCPIYELIKANTRDGRLPDDFSIPWLQDMWAPGAQDGVLLNHMAPLSPDGEREQKILEALKLMASEDNGKHTDEIFTVFEALDQEFGIVRLYEEICRAIALHQQELNLGNLLEYGDWLLCSGTSLLAVKLGLTVLSGFSAPFVEEVMVEMGVYDEFTYYAARTLSRKSWRNGNEELFSLAKVLQGWGRIHAVEWLRPETQEIRDWLLYEGASNTVLPQYSADICLQKAEAEQRLDSALSAKEYEAIGKLIRESLEQGGPCRGVTDGERLLPKYVARAKDFRPDPEALRLIPDAAEEYGLGPDVVEAARRLAGA